MFDRFNLAHDPAKCGAEQIAVLNDDHADYDFDNFYAFKRLADGAVFVVQDSGCSCPAPLENISSWDDMTRVEPHNFEATVVQPAMARAADDGSSYRSRMNDLPTVLDFIEKIRQAVKDASPAGPANG